MVNPYQSPEPDSDAIPLSSRAVRVVRTIFCVINLIAAGMFAASAIAAIFSGDGAIGALVAIMFGPIFVFYAVCEALAIVLPFVERKLGCANLVCAAFVVFGVVANTGEAVSEPKIAWGVLFVFIPIGSSIALYLLGCGWLRLRIVVDK